MKQNTLHASTRRRFPVNHGLPQPRSPVSSRIHLRTREAVVALYFRFRRVPLEYFPNVLTVFAVAIAAVRAARVTFFQQVNKHIHQRQIDRVTLLLGAIGRESQQAGRVDQFQRISADVAIRIRACFEPDRIRFDVVTDRRVVVAPPVVDEPGFGVEAK